MAKLLVYQDYVHNNACLYGCLAGHFGAESVGWINADDLCKGSLDQNVTAFFMPGGASRYVDDKLAGHGNAAIRNYVLHGGSYIGICAGAYYASQKTIWNKGFTDEIITTNELGFFRGDATGPYGDNLVNGHSAFLTTLDNGRRVLYWSSPIFQGEDPNCTVLARYAELNCTPPAVITGTLGNGRFLLISPHLEIDAQHLQMMTFAVKNNRYDELTRLEDTSGVTTDYFLHLLNDFIGTK